MVPNSGPTMLQNGGFWQGETAVENAVGAQDGGRPAKDAVLTTVVLEWLSMRTRLSRGLARTYDARTPYAMAAKGGGRSSAIIRRMSENRLLGMATSAIWKAT